MSKNPKNVKSTYMSQIKGAFSKARSKKVVAFLRRQSQKETTPLISLTEFCLFGPKVGQEPSSEHRRRQTKRVWGETSVRPSPIRKCYVFTCNECGRYGAHLSADRLKKPLVSSKNSAPEQKKYTVSRQHIPRGQVESQRA